MEALAAAKYCWTLTDTYTHSMGVSKAYFFHFYE
jgi:hypothetical protein